MAPTSNNIKTEVSNELISGTKIAVPDCEAATHSIIVCKSSKGIDLRLVDLSCNEISINQADNIDGSRGHYSIEMKQAPSTLIGHEGNGRILYESIVN